MTSRDFGVAPPHLTPTPPGAPTPPVNMADAAGTVEPLTRVQHREECYVARDAFYACLDASATGADASACGAQAQAYQGACMRSWVRWQAGRVHEIKT